MKFFTLATCVAVALAGSLPAVQAQAAESAPEKSAKKKSDIYQSVVRIECATQVPNYGTPWNTGRFSGGTGTGFLIGQNRILTNAHVVSNARRLLITKHGSSRKHRARVAHIAHDCDLAILELEDFSPFEDLPHLEIGTVPRLESQVRVIGYPVGGDRISVTRGVVSRIDFRPYSHSRVDAHLVVQIDAAINPGNSGGPVLQDGKVVGVAFQGLRSADNTGYIIPTPVISRFLKDVEDGNYDEYVDLGISQFSLHNPAMRKVYGLAPNAPGVLVASVTPESPCDGVLQQGDILTALDGNAIDSGGSVILDGENVLMDEIVERKFAGDKVQLTFIRDGKEQTTSVELKAFPYSRLYSIKYGERPRYTVQGGLVFQPLSVNLYSAHRINNPRVRQLFAKYVSDGTFKERKDIVILTQVLSDPINSDFRNYEGRAIESINGVKVTDLNHAHALLNPKTLPEFFVIRCDGLTRPVILPTAEMKSANTRIQQNYGISNSSYLSK